MDCDLWVGLSVVFVEVRGGEGVCALGCIWGRLGGLRVCHECSDEEPCEKVVTGVKNCCIGWVYGRVMGWSEIGEGGNGGEFW